LSHRYVFCLADSLGWKGPARYFMMQPIKRRK
jgi:hypothetical protein